MVLDADVAVMVLDPAAGEQLAQTLTQAVGGDLLTTDEREGAPDCSFGHPAEVADPPQLIDQRSLVQGPAAHACQLHRPVVGRCERAGGDKIVNVGELDRGSLSWIAAVHAPMVRCARRHSCSRHPPANVGNHLDPTIPERGPRDLRRNHEATRYVDQHVAHSDAKTRSATDIR
jgi:hypothetical protein